jgi:tRNA dimethylallyltransferase
MIKHKIQFQNLAKQIIDSKQVLTIMGPTASGKSSLSMALSRVMDVEIISVDSALIYQGMDIGTAKPTNEELQQVKHHLINILTPDKTYSAAEFVADVHRLVPEIWARGKVPMLVGGTMMYYHALQQGMAKLPSADEDLRAKLQQQWLEDPESLYEKLQLVDPVITQRIHSNDQQRICRALEVFELTGKPLSQHQQEGQLQEVKTLKLLKVGLMVTDRKKLHKIIEVRFKKMWSNGLENEIKLLRANSSLHIDLPSIRSVGYRQAWEYLDGKVDYETFVEKAIIATRQLAKRQITWLRKEQNMLVLDPFNLQEDELVLNILHHFGVE